MKAIREDRQQLQRDLQELDQQLPALMGKLKRVAGLAAAATGAAGMALGFMKRRKARKRKDDRSTEVVVRIVGGDDPKP